MDAFSLKARNLFCTELNKASGTNSCTSIQNVHLIREIGKVDITVLNCEVTEQQVLQPFLAIAPIFVQTGPYTPFSHPTPTTFLEL